LPLINLRTNRPDIDHPESLLQQLSAALAKATGKPEAYVMTLFEGGVPMTFAGQSEPCAYVEIKSIGALAPAAMTREFCELIENAIGIPKDRIYIGFDDVDATCWGWNGRTFG
jgi:phenylpyruvate tautomerase PptA (4-oxalocrotonate tautomerase family)